MGMKIEIPVCKMCGRELGQLIPQLGSIICSSDYIPNNPYCRSCQIEHCVKTNCLGCEIGKYPECQHLDMKRFYLEPDE